MMISTVSLQSTDAAANAAPATGESADTGVFDALMALQSLINADAAGGVATQIAGSLEGADLAAGLEDDMADDSTEEATGSPDDVLCFLAAPLMAPTVPAAAAGGSDHAIPIRNDTSPPGTGAPFAAAPQTASANGSHTSADDLAQAFALAAPDTPDTKAGPVIDTTAWNSLSAPAELFAHASRSTSQDARVESAPVTTHVRDPRWADDLGNRLASMVRTGETSASLQLTPVDLGPLEVNVSVRDNQATVHFGAAQAETRALLEASMPRLREMLASQGFQLMDSSVSHGFARQTRQESAGTPRVDAIGEAPMIPAQAVHITGLLDLYA